MKVLLIDGLNLIRRIFAAVPGDNNNEEKLLNALNSVRQSVERACREHNPSHALCVLEESGQTHRHQIYPDYKKNRSPMPTLLSQQFHRFQQQLTECGISHTSVPGYEADDVIATIANKVSSRGGQVIILSTDLLLCQLLNNNIQVRDHFQQRWLDEAYVVKKFGVTAKQLRCYFGLVGIASSHLPGVKSIGAKTATHLLNDFHNLEAILAESHRIPGAAGRALREQTQQARLSKSLVTLKTDVAVGITLSDARYQHP